jgi:hypothetical protein
MTIIPGRFTTFKTFLKNPEKSPQRWKLRLLKKFLQ